METLRFTCGMPGSSGVEKPVIQHQFGPPELHLLDRQQNCPAAWHECVQIRQHTEKTSQTSTSSTLEALSYCGLWGQWGSGEQSQGSAELNCLLLLAREPTDPVASTRTPQSQQRFLAKPLDSQLAGKSLTLKDCCVAINDQYLFDIRWNIRAI